MLYRRIVIAILMVMVSSNLFAQKVSGYVQDETTKEPIPYANVWIKGTLQGIMTDVDGHFSISSPKNDTLCVSSVGYVQKDTPITMNGDNNLTILLQEEVQNLNEVTVKPEVPRAKVLFNKIQEHKKANRRAIEAVEDYKRIESTTMYIAVDSTSRINRMVDNMNEVTVEIDNQHLRFSPVYLAEEAQQVTKDSVQMVYQKKDGIFPRLNQAFETYIIKNVVVDLNFYKDQVFILDRGFISPISNSGMSYYNLYLNDSTTIDSTKYYDFSFAPKNKFNQLFSGHFRIEDGSFALSSMDVYISKDANLNFVNGFEGHVVFKKQADSTWFYNEQSINVNLAFRMNKDSLSNYSSKRMENIEKGSWLISKSTHYSASKRLDNVKASSWLSQPEFASERLDDQTYASVNKLKEQKVIKGIDKVGGMVLSSYVNAGKIDIGPVYDIYSTNTIEGNRLSIPLRTSEKMFERFSIGGFLGYGTKNNAFKYGANLVYQPQETDRFVFRMNYSNDYRLVSQDQFLRFIKNNPNNKGTGNFIAIFTSRQRNPYLKEEKSLDFRMEYNAPNSLHLEMNPYFLESTGTPAVHFFRNGTEYNRYKNYGVLFDLRLTFAQHYDKYYFDRVYYVNPIPIVNLTWDMGQTLLPGQSKSDAGMYGHFHGAIQGRINMGQIFMNYIFNAGYLFGKAPYDLLDQPVASMSLGYSKDRYNLLHYASFAHNLYSNVHLHFNGGGVFFNRIPVVRKMKLREIVSFKCHYGTLSDAYKGVFDLPDYYTNNYHEPYTEVGVGVTNVFKILRIEYVHQFSNTYRNQGFTDNSGLRFRAEMSF